MVEPNKRMMHQMTRIMISSSVSHPIILALFHIVVVTTAFSGVAGVASDADALLKFKDSLQNNEKLGNWKKRIDPCTGKTANWAGVLCDEKGRVWGLQLNEMGLKGAIDVDAVKEIADLKTISVMKNNFDGPLPELKKLGQLKTVYLSDNKFSGEIPADAFAGMMLKKIHLANNEFTGEIPKSLATVNNLVEVRLEGNKFQGMIPDFLQPRLLSFNVSNNKLEGKIPQNLQKLDASCFAGNDDLCGGQLKECPSKKPSPTVSTALIVIIVLVVLVIVAVLLFLVVLRRRSKASQSIEDPPSIAVECESMAQNGSLDTQSPPCESLNIGERKAESLKLSFVRDDRERFDMQDLLKASAEVLGSGSFGSSYKAALLSGPVMVVKRYKQMNNVVREDFQEHMRRIGRLEHTHLLPLVAYYYKKEEKLLITDHVANGSLAAHLHGHQTLGLPSLDWPTRLKIVKGVAQGLRYLYTELPSLTAAHGHLKSANVLLNESLKPLLTDYGLIPIVNHEHAQNLMVAYKSPEYLQTQRITKKTDVWSLGVLILEILTGKLPTNFLQKGKGSEEDLASWVNSVPREEWFHQVFDREMGAARSNEGEMVKLLNIGLDCCEGDAKKRWDLKEAVERIEELKERDGDDDFFSSCASEADMTKIVDPAVMMN